MGDLSRQISQRTSHVVRAHAWRWAAPPFGGPASSPPGDKRFFPSGYDKCTDTVGGDIGTGLASAVDEQLAQTRHRQDPARAISGAPGGARRSARMGTHAPIADRNARADIGSATRPSLRATPPSHGRRVRTVSFRFAKLREPSLFHRKVAGNFKRDVARLLPEKRGRRGGNLAKSKMVVRKPGERGWGRVKAHPEGKKNARHYRVSFLWAWWGGRKFLIRPAVLKKPVPNGYMPHFKLCSVH